MNNVQNLFPEKSTDRKIEIVAQSTHTHTYIHIYKELTRYKFKASMINRKRKMRNLAVKNIYDPSFFLKLN